MSDNSKGQIDASISDMASEENPTVKSTAVVKYSAYPTPVTFAQLQCNTDLKLPPSNWLSTSAESYGLQNVWHRGTGFTSFRMAHMFPDCVGEVDVISDAENIKKLLKIPYSNAPISMIVHRVENTLLLDDFDIHKFLLKQEEDDWSWLRKFCQELISDLGAKEKRISTKANSRNAIQQKNLISKFLYHSLVLPEGEKTKEPTPKLPVETLQQSLPEPTKEEQLPDPNDQCNYTRNVVWTFENIQMLIGTNMPIFGGQTHPCISLKLRDASKPINVLTGIDYWLDNLMCNVPEVIMCCHIDGIVQKYELIKTEDLPNLHDSQFSPKVIKDIAQNILTFLKHNATKAGHTYWLFKAKNDDFVKLYDLTSLCDESDDKTQNPFTVPVAMLLYRVARNMKYSADCEKYQGTIRMLLKNCIQLLPKEKYPQIVTSAHFMISDLYVPADTDPSNPNLKDQEEEDNQSDSGSQTDDRSEERFEQDVNAAIKCLTLANITDPHCKDEHGNLKFKPPPMTGSVEERCQAALEHVAAGLECLKYFPNNSETTHAGDACEETTVQPEKNKHEYDEASLNMAKPYQAIPMPYEPINKLTASEILIHGVSETTDSDNSQIKKRSKQKKKKPAVKNPSENDSSGKALLCKVESQTLPTWQAPKKDDNRSWSAHLRILLNEKASLVFAVLAEQEYSLKNYGASLRYILSVLRCQKLLEVFCDVKNEKVISYLLGRAGDCCFMIVQDWSNIEKHRNDFETKNVIEDSITDPIFAIENLDLNFVEIIPEKFESMEKNLLVSCHCYEKALSLNPLESDRNTLLVRYGNIHNELGVLYMNQASSRYHKNSELEELDVTTPLVKSLRHFESGVKAFEKVSDDTNLALVHSNIGRLMRLCAHVHKIEHASRERHFYNKAIASYHKALQYLGSRKTSPDIWDAVTWDLSTTLYTLASILQDYPDVRNENNDGLEREVVDTFQKALKYCDTETPGSRQPVYQFRAAGIQHRLASLYHKIYRDLVKSGVESDNPKLKNCLQLAKQYYGKSSQLLLTLEQTCEYLTVQLELVALYELQAQVSTTPTSKLKAYQAALEVIIQSRPVNKLVLARHESVKKKGNLSKGHEKNKINMKKQKKSKADKKDTNIPNVLLIKEDKTISDDDSGSDEKELKEEEESLFQLLQQRVQFVLLSLIKLYKTKNSMNPKKGNENLIDVYKKCYSLTLRSGDIPLTDLIRYLDENLEKIAKILEDHKLSSRGFSND
uniref:Erythroid differentiation-related factor 1 n=1 Tax=Trichogramma kaykai TaxID=54128 RepID=A0ABD2XJ45_9HYME